MKWNSLIFIIGTVSSLSLIIAAVVLKVLPPKKINYLYGYRTKRSMKNERSWNFAQKKSSREMLRWSIGYLILSLLSVFWNLNQLIIELSVALVMLLIFVLVPIYRTEVALRAFEREKAG